MPTRRYYLHRYLSRCWDTVRALRIDRTSLRRKQRQEKSTVLSFKRLLIKYFETPQRISNLDLESVNFPVTEPQQCSHEGFQVEELGQKIAPGEELQWSPTF